MMKRILSLLLVALLLCGCAADRQSPTTALTVPAPTDATEPAGSYAPGSDVEVLTAGAVRAYPVANSHSYAIVAVGGDVLLFSGIETTTLTKLSGDNLYTTAVTQLDLAVSPEDPSFRITENGITYFDFNTREVVFLDNDLKEVNRIQTPVEMIGSPILTANRLKLYYCTESSVRVLDLETGIDRLLKEMIYPEQNLSGILMSDQVLWCSIFDGEETLSMFISTETGEQLGQTDGEIAVTSHNNNYFGKVPEGTMQAHVFGRFDGEPQMLIPANAFADVWYLESANAAVSVSRSGETVHFACYDLESGLCSAALELNINTPRAVEAEENFVYILTDEPETGAQVIYRWDVTQSSTGDETVYTGPWYTLESPDTEGLAACADRARQLGEQYGVEILVGFDATATQPWDYDMYPEYQVPVIDQELAQLESLLANFPEGFFATLADDTTEGAVKISLVRSLTGSPESGSLAAANGIQFWEGEKAYVSLAAGEALERTFYHELFHILETRVFSECTAYYDWDKLNPVGFRYDNDYIANQERDGSEYLEDATRAFVDTYSMSYPKEDRARIMEYAATSGNESYFQSETMQAKLRTLCKGIREAFDLREYPNVLIWEQYLNKPLTP